MVNSNFFMYKYRVLSKLFFIFVIISVFLKAKFKCGEFFHPNLIRAIILFYSVLQQKKYIIQLFI